MSDYIKVCGHGYTEKCPTCRDVREEHENAYLLAAKDAEIARLKVECESRKHYQDMDGRAMRMANNELARRRVEIAALKAELARYTGPLTDEQAQAAATIVASSSGIYVSGYSLKWDAAIREVRGK